MGHYCSRANTCVLEHFIEFLNYDIITTFHIFNFTHEYTFNEKEVRVDKIRVLRALHIAY